MADSLSVSTDLKSTLKKYYEAQQASKALPSLRKRAVELIKAEGMTDKEFKMNENTTLSYQKYTRQGDLSLKLINEVLDTLYPDINRKQIMEEIKRRRDLDRKTVETISSN